MVLYILVYKLKSNNAEEINEQTLHLPDIGDIAKDSGFIS